VQIPAESSPRAQHKRTVEAFYSLGRQTGPEDGMGRQEWKRTRYVSSAGPEIVGLGYSEEPASRDVREGRNPVTRRVWRRVGNTRGAIAKADNTRMRLRGQDEGVAWSWLEVWH
jgi:hypothetical protein